MSEWSLSGIYVFSERHTTAFLRLGKVDNTSALLLQAILNSYITNTKYKNAKTVPWLSRPQKGHLITVWELTQEGRYHLSDLSWECAEWLTQIFCSVHIQKWPRKVPCVLILGLLIIFSGRQISTYRGCE